MSLTSQLIEKQKKTRIRNNYTDKLSKEREEIIRNNCFYNHLKKADNQLKKSLNLRK